MTKPELGTKRLCAGCNAKFYDLLKTPIVCPMCEAVFTVPKPAPERPRRGGYEPRPVALAMTAGAAPDLAAKVEDAPTGDNADGDNADGEKEAEGGVEILEEIDED